MTVGSHVGVIYGRGLCRHALIECGSRQRRDPRALQAGRRRRDGCRRRRSDPICRQRGRSLCSTPRQYSTTWVLRVLLRGSDGTFTLLEAEPSCCRGGDRDARARGAAFAYRPLRIGGQDGQGRFLLPARSPTTARCGARRGLSTGGAVESRREGPGALGTARGPASLTSTQRRRSAGGAHPVTAPPDQTQRMRPRRPPPPPQARRSRLDREITRAVYRY